MNMTMTGWVPMALLASALSVSTATAQTEGDSLCNYRSASFAKLDPADFAGCVKLRTKGIAAKASPTVWSLTNQSVFPTLCPVQIAESAAHPTECSTVAAEALKTGDLVRVDEWAPDQLELVILRKGESVFHPSRPRVFLKPATAELDGNVHTVGYFADALVYATAEHKGEPIPASYYVYLANIIQNGSPVRWYQIEVFEDNQKCRQEIPGTPTAGTEIVACDVGAITAPVRLRGQHGYKQSPLGGGGEPPPTPNR